MTGESAQTLQVVDLIIASALLIGVGVISVLLRLRQERSLALAAVRMVLQLALIGYLLRWLFDPQRAGLAVGWAVIMVGFATHAAVQRARYRVSGVWLQSFASLLLGSALTMTYALTLVVSVEPWYQARYLIPLLGMLLGNGLTGISLCVDVLLETLAERRHLVEMELALGATRWEALRDTLRNAVRRALIPITNTMTVAGLVALPGMMTGQILQGADPLQAVAYQILIMFMIAATVAISSIAMAVLLVLRCTNERHQLLHEVVERK
jgi:putative ABC transport system permease protein